MHLFSTLEGFKASGAVDPSGAQLAATGERDAVTHLLGTVDPGCDSRAALFQAAAHAQSQQNLQPGFF